MLIHDSGLEMYPQLLSTKPDIVEQYRECWELFVPMVQQAPGGLCRRSCRDQCSDR